VIFSSGQRPAAVGCRVVVIDGDGASKVAPSLLGEVFCPANPE
jgi:hypothetical protein